jgi:hypothetical protein
MVDVRERVRTSFKLIGVTRTAKALGLSAETVLRVGAGAGVQSGTMVLVEQRLDRLPTETSKAAV